MNSNQIGRFVESVQKWNPCREGAGTFTYVDISSVDHVARAVTQSTTVATSEAPSRARQLIAAGDVLVSTVRPNLNAVAYVGPNLDGATASTGFCVLRPRPDELDGRYLFHWVQSRQFIGHLVQLATGASYPAVSDKIVKATPIPLPAIEEQRRIAAVLDAADALRTKRRMTLAKLGTLTQAIFAGMFGAGEGEKKSLGQLAEVQGGLQVTSKRKTHAISVPYMRVANVRRGYLDLSELKSLRVSEQELARTRLAAGDLLVVEGHGNIDEIGRVGVWDGSIDPCVHQNHLIRVRCSENQLLPRFAEAFMNSSVGRRALHQAANTTSGLNTISTNDVREVQIPLPALSEQQRFVGMANCVDRQRAVLTVASAELDTLFASLQQRAFRGEL